MKSSWVFVGIILGILTGFFLPEFSKKIKIIGDIFLLLLKMLVLPLVIVAITGAIINLGSFDKLKKIGTFTVSMYFFTMFVSVIVGIFFIVLLDPSDGMKVVKNEFNVSTKTFDDFILSFFPSNVFKSIVDGNILQVIFFCTLVGIAILKVGREIEKVSYFFNYLFDVMMVLVRWVVSLTPIGVFSLISNMVANSGLDVFVSLFKYVISVVGGILFQGLFFLPLIIFLFTKHNPFVVIKNSISALLVAFSTCSSSATLPVSMEVCIDKIKLRKEIVDFVLPLGATVNMNGTALYEAVAAIFVASVFGIDLNFYQYFVISLTAVLAAVGAAAIPGAGLVTMSIVFSAVGIPLEGIGLIVVVDRFLDMFRTALNVWGDIVVAFIVDKRTNP